MGHGTEHHLEHAEHAKHHAQDPFDRRVAMTMTMMAAVLAGVTLVSHRGHTETLRLATEATTSHTKASDEWNLYQAKNIRNHEYQAFLFLQSMLSKEALKQDDESAAMRNYWIGQVDKFEGKDAWKKFVAGVVKSKEKSVPMPKADQAADAHEAADQKPKVEAHETAGQKSKTEGHETAGHKAKDAAVSSSGSGEKAALKTSAEGLQAHAKDLESQSHAVHEHVTWIDIGHLGLELALVFCAVAVLTKQKSFWLTGVVFGLAGSGIASYGMIGLWLMDGGGGGGHH